MGQFAHLERSKGLPGALIEHDRCCRRLWDGVRTSDVRLLADRARSLTSGEGTAY